MSQPDSRSAPRRSVRRPLAVIAAAAAVALVPSAVLAGHAAFLDGPFGVHDAGVHYVSDAGITAGCGDGSRYCANNTVTRGQMATFLHRMSGNGSIAPNVNAATLDGLDSTAFAPARVSTLEREPNSDIATANDHPIAEGPAHGAVVGDNHDYWRVQHPGGVLFGETFTVKCSDATFGDTVLTLFGADGTQIANNDDIGGGNFCSRISQEQPAGTYYFRVRGFGNVTVPWYGLIVQAPLAASVGASSADDAGALDRKP